MNHIPSSAAVQLFKNPQKNFVGLCLVKQPAMTYLSFTKAYGRTAMGRSVKRDMFAKVKAALIQSKKINVGGQVEDEVIFAMHRLEQGQMPMGTTLGDQIEIPIEAPAEIPKVSGVQRVLERDYGNSRAKKTYRTPEQARAMREFIIMDPAITHKGLLEKLAETGQPPVTLGNYYQVKKDLRQKGKIPEDAGFIRGPRGSSGGISREYFKGRPVEEIMRLRFSEYYKDTEHEITQHGFEQNRRKYLGELVAKDEKLRKRFPELVVTDIKKAQKFKPTIAYVAPPAPPPPKTTSMDVPQKFATFSIQEWPQPEHAKIKGLVEAILKQVPTSDRFQIRLSYSPPELIIDKVVTFQVLDQG